MIAPEGSEVQGILRVALAALTDADEFITAHMAGCTDLGLTDAQMTAARLVLEHLSAAQRGLRRITAAQP